MKSAQRLAGLRPMGNVHILRHTFCSHLAMRGAPANVVQELAGHTHLATTRRDGGRRDGVDLWELELA